MSTAAPTASRAARRFQQAVELHLAGDRVGAANGYRAVLALEPANYEALNNLAAALSELGQPDEALAAFRRAAEINPGYAHAHHNLGLMLSHRREHAAAVPHLERAVALQPNAAPWWNDLGNAFQELLLNERALVAYDRALTIAPRMYEAMNNRGVVLRGMLRREEAIEALRDALAVEPRYVHALNNLAILLKELRRFDEAIAVFERALIVEPDAASVLANMSALHQELGRLDTALHLAQRAVRANPNLADAYNALGNCHYESARLDEARACYEQALAVQPHDPNATYNLSLQLLGAGDMVRGWSLFESRLRLQALGFDLRHLDTPLWDGSPLDGRTILLHCEQGLGDSIQFVRYATALKARGAGRIVMECIPGSTALLATAPGIDQTVTRGGETPAHDVRAYLLSLPALLGTTLETIPSGVPYLRAEARTATAMVRDEPNVLKVGVCWAGNPVHQRDRLRSIPLDQLRAVFDVPGVRFYSLQKGGAERHLETLARTLPTDTVIDLAPHLNDFRDTAAIIERLDLVIAVDTSVAHLAGALGAKTWLLLPHIADFRWLREREDSPWYPTMRLFRQPSPQQWAPAIDATIRALRELVGAPTSARVSDDVPPVVSIASIARRGDGSPRFEIVLPLARIAVDAAFAEYRAELLGESGGFQRIARDVLDEMLTDGDTLIDTAPGLGVVTTSALTIAGGAARVIAVEPEAARASDLCRNAGAHHVGDRLRIAASLAEAVSLATVETGRAIVRFAADALGLETVATLGALHRARRLAAIIVADATPASIAPALESLQAAGFVVLAATTVQGETSLDPIAEVDVPQTIVALADWRIAELSGVESQEPAVVSTTTSPDPLPTPDSRLPTQLGIDWPIASDSGWGVYGMNLALQLVRRGGVKPALLAASGTGSMPPVARHQLASAIETAAPRLAALASNRVVEIDGPVLRALGNNAVHNEQARRITSRGVAGMIFFEDTRFDAQALAHLRGLDLVVAGSTWNAEVLRAKGVERATCVLQGIDPTVFHPAPRSRQLADRFVIFSGGKLEYRKGQDIVVAAFRIFRERHPEALLVTAWHNHWAHLIGDLSVAGHVRGAPKVGPDGMRVREWLAANGVPASSVLDIGAMPNAIMGQVVREADVALFTNRCEGGTNLVAMECMASGVPTIVSANTGHLDLVRLGGCLPLERQRPAKPTAAFRATDGWGESDVDEIVDTLERLYDDRALAARLSDDGARALGALTWERQIGELLDALEPLL